MRYFLMIILFLLVFAGILLLTFAGCSDEKPLSPGTERDDGPASLSTRIERNNEFAVDVFAKLAGSDDNLIVSPHSIATCFGMAYAGARGRTERQIADVLGFNYPPAGFHSILGHLNYVLEHRAGVDLLISNGCWWQAGTHWQQAFLDTISQSYDAELDSLDFAGDPTGACAIINQWVADQTSGYLTDLLPPSAITPATVLVLANTIYFMAKWLYPFDPDFTYTGLFHRLDDSEVNVTYMMGEAVIPYVQGADYCAIEMPYEGEQTSMVFILPNEGCYEAFEDTFTVATFEVIADELRNSSNHCVMLYVPQFGFFSQFDLNQTLQEMGMADAFTPGVANFSGMDGTNDGSPWIDFVVHKAYIMINEYGTLAFAGTAMGFTVGECGSFFAGRPFIFAIQDKPTGTILFMGRVLDPNVGDYLSWPQ